MLAAVALDTRDGFEPNKRMKYHNIGVHERNRLYLALTVKYTMQHEVIGEENKYRKAVNGVRA